ncbi:hypothetical protein HPB50_003104 [Hyalomma asiaticum]|uniref:Uncharacterized protein n=1 Tax=Hyalomma asiaticum TaxID=266040 RepID=A0ACB7TAA9_HYAAI|nr:hypothetical protein HPB50_003104 [Hyalomma asiaticum]
MQTGLKGHFVTRGVAVNNFVAAAQYFFSRLLCASPSPRQRLEEPCCARIRSAAAIAATPEMRPLCAIPLGCHTGGGHRNNFHFGGVIGECDDRRGCIVLWLWPRCSVVGGLEHMIVAVARPYHLQRLQCRGGGAFVATFPEPSR